MDGTGEGQEDQVPRTIISCKKRSREECQYCSVLQNFLYDAEAVFVTLEAGSVLKAVPAKCREDLRQRWGTV